LESLRSTHGDGEVKVGVASVTQVIWTVHLVSVRVIAGKVDEAVCCVASAPIGDDWSVLR